MNKVIEKDKFGGEYISVQFEKAEPRVEFRAEELTDVAGFVCSYRAEPFFMSAMAGEKVDDISKETQWLGIKHTDGTYSVYFSMAFEQYRTSLYGKENALWVVGVTGDDAVSNTEFCAYYKISGENFYALIDAAARSLRDRYDTVRLRTEKPAPDFMDYFGWCTWDSFYDLVKGDDIPVGLENFKEGGFVPKLLILDDGWQTTVDQKLSRGQWKLSNFVANEKFGYGLRETVNIAKEQYGVEKFFVWHAVLGYWGGVSTDAEEMQKYEPVLNEAVHTDELKETGPARWESEKFPFGLIAPEHFGEFYEDYHSYLESEGIDGVKIDVQSSLEGHAQGRGGRIRMNRMMREGLEASVNKHFNGNVINCMSCSNDIIYHVKNSNMMRSSGDFVPNEPESHSAHIFANAIHSLWMSPFTICDWDMFQTSHEFGPFHAAARAISGGPVYVSDRVNEHNFEIIRSLTDAEGKILKPQQIALPTEDCLFRNPNVDKGLYKIFNHNKYNSVVGVFAFDETPHSIEVSPRDIRGTKGEARDCMKKQYAAYSYKTKQTYVLGEDDAITVTLGKAEADILTIAEIKDGFAVIGLTEKLNSGGAVKSVDMTANTVAMEVVDKGTLLLYCDKEFKEIKNNDVPVAFSVENGMVFVQVSEDGTVTIS